MKSIKTILTVAVLGLSANAFAMGDDAGSISKYLSGGTVAVTSHAASEQGASTNFSNLGGADYFQAQREGEYN